MSSNGNVVSCSQQIFEKKHGEFTSEVWVFSLFCEFQDIIDSILAANFLSADSSPTILLIDRSEPTFERHTGGQITKTLKNDENFDGFC